MKVLLMAVVFGALGGLVVFGLTAASRGYCYEAQVYVAGPYGGVLVGDQEVCVGTMHGPSKMAGSVQ